MKRGHDWFFYRLQCVEEPIAVRPAEKTVFVLRVEYIAGMGIDKLRQIFIGATISLRLPCDHFGRIGSQDTVWFVDRDDVSRVSSEGIIARNDVAGERRNSTFPRGIGSKKKHARMHETAS
jgi:hypothetical protein